MDDAGVIFKTSSGRDPEQFFLDVARDIVPTVGDAVFAAEMHKTRILERTARGVDVEERPFAPYSDRGPYYYYPSKTAANRKAATARTFRQVSKAGGVGGAKTGLGIKFEGGYAAFKSWLGRATVDLRGPRAPHMLQALVVRVAGGEAAANSSAPASEISVGIWGEEAARASGHNQGAPGLPQRKFIGASQRDQELFGNHLLDRVFQRLRFFRRAA